MELYSNRNGDKKVKKQDQRQIKLLEMLRSHQRLDIASVTSELTISEATARRLFAKLEKDGKLIRIHGGIQIAPQLNNDYSFQLSATQQTHEKEMIGKTAAEMVSSGDRVFLDAGTTTLKMAEFLSLRIQTEKLKGVTIITNSLSLMHNLAEHCEVILVGGRIRAQRHDVYGPLTRQILGQFNFDKVFFGVDAISAAGELMTTDTETAEVNSMFLQRTHKAYVLADAKKLNKKSLVTFAMLKNMNGIIIDPAGAAILRRQPGCKHYPQIYQASKI